MELLPAALTFAAVVLTVVALVLPLVRTQDDDAERDGAENLSELGRMREARNIALTAIMDLDDDLERGNSTPAEHRAARVPFVRRAAALIREIDGREHVLDEEIERIVQRRRKATLRTEFLANPDDAPESTS